MVIRWMMATVEQDGNYDTIAAKAVNHFPRVFRQNLRAANRKKARDWWINRNIYLARFEAFENSFTWSSSRRGGAAQTRIERKATHGRWRQRGVWKEETDAFMLDGVKVSRSTLRDIALAYLEQANHLNIQQAQAIQLMSK